jgi:hypothetical protein
VINGGCNGRLNLRGEEMEIVINTCYGGFGLSEKAYEYLGLKWDGYGNDYRGYEMRADPKLVECVRALGEDAFGECARLKIVEIPDGIDWEINEYDGIETVVEQHRSWN